MDISLLGTYSLTKKLSRTAADFTFHCLLNVDASILPHGWCCHATCLFTYTQQQGKMVAQATIWKDNMIVGVLHSHLGQLITEEFDISVQ